jgi:hypothetical protein
VADFLVFLFRVLRVLPGPISGYRSAVSSTLRAQGRLDVSHDPTLKALLRSFHLERPTTLQTIPQWNLALVLDALHYPPFEPLPSMPMAHLTVKTVFLTSLACSRWRGELHATIQAGSGCTESLSSFLLPVELSFLAKSPRLDCKRLQPLVIPGLPAADPLERTICPVRTFVAYATRARRLRQQFSDVDRSQFPQFFLSYKPGYHHPVRPQTISRWLKNAIAWAYASSAQSPRLLQLHTVQTHDVRAMAPSLAFFCSVAVDDIFAAATWNNSTTFTSFSLRDLSYIADDLQRLGPIVAAQPIVQVPAPRHSYRVTSTTSSLYCCDSSV